MNMRKTIGVAAVGLGILGMASVGQAARLEFDIGVAPPPERYEVVPAPRDGFIYERGHYAWDGNNYVWRDGQFIRHREGHVYTPYLFERRGEKTWHFRSGHWDDD